MGSYTYRITEGADDVYCQSDGGNWNTGETTFRYARPPKVAWLYEQYLRFATDANLPAGSTVTSALLRCYNFAASGATSTMQLRILNERDAAMPASRPVDGLFIAGQVQEIIPASLPAAAYWTIPNSFHALFNTWMGDIDGGYVEGDHVVIAMRAGTIAGFGIGQFEAWEFVGGDNVAELLLEFTPPVAGMPARIARHSALGKRLIWRA